MLEATSSLSGRPDYLVVEALDVEGNLQQITDSLQQGESDPSRQALSSEDRRRLALAVADLFRLLADRAVRHPDMKPTNILVSRADGEFRLWLVDLDRSRFDVRWRRRRWIQHLAQCNAGLSGGVTPLERMRCLRRCGLGRWGPAERLQIARAVYDRSLGRNPVWLRHELSGQQPG